jgi:hypothetical protein
MSHNRSVLAWIIAGALLCQQSQVLASSSRLIGAAAMAAPIQSNAYAETNRFGEAEYYLKAPGQSKARPVRGSLLFDGALKAVRFTSEEGIHLDVPFNAVTNLVYERSAKPRYALGILFAWPLLFTKSKKHFLTIQYRDGRGEGQWALIRLDKDNYQGALATAEAQTGLKVQRVEEN